MIMKRFFILAIFSLTLIECSPPWSAGNLGPLQLFVKDSTGADLIAKNLAEYFQKDTTFGFKLPSLPLDLYDFSICIDGKDSGPLPVQMSQNEGRFYLSLDVGSKKYDYIANMHEYENYVYNLTFPLLFGDNKTIHIEVQWHIDRFKWGYSTSITKLLVNGHPEPISCYTLILTV